MHRLVKYLFRKFKIIVLIDKISIKYEVEDGNDKEKNTDVKVQKKLSHKVKIDEISAKSVSYYIFLVFFRLAIIVI